MYYALAAVAGVIAGAALSEIFGARAISAVKSEIAAVEGRLRGFIDSKFKASAKK